jgi:hypothetical protein
LMQHPISREGREHPGPLFVLFPRQRLSPAVAGVCKFTTNRLISHHDTEGNGLSGASPAGSEVDVVLEKANGAVAAIEVKASASVDTSDFASLQTLRDQLGSQFRAGVVLYSGDQTLPFGDRLWLVPLSVLWTA